MGHAHEITLWYTFEVSFKICDVYPCDHFHMGAPSSPQEAKQITEKHASILSKVQMLALKVRFYCIIQSVKHHFLSPDVHQNDEGRQVQSDALLSRR